MPRFRRACVGALAQSKPPSVQVNFSGVGFSADIAMKFWGTKRAEEAAHPGVAAVAAPGVSREAWIREAIWDIAAATAAERVGVWLEAGPTQDSAAQGVFRGLVWDRDSLETPSE